MIPKTNDKYLVHHRVTITRMMKSWVTRRLIEVLSARGGKTLLDSTAIFIVGCGHSGTTLCADRLGRASEICMIPRETYIFRPQLPQSAGRSFMFQVSTLARSLGFNALLEKTPKHVHCVDRIRSTIENPVFIALIRNPLDSCASLKARYGCIERPAERWVMDNTAVSEHFDDPDFLVLKYEEICTEPKDQFERMFAHCGLSFDQMVLNSGAPKFDEFTQGSGEVGIAHVLERKQQIAEEIQPRINTWDGKLSKAERSFVREKTTALCRKFNYSYDDDDRLLL